MDKITRNRADITIKITNKASNTLKYRELKNGRLLSLSAHGSLIAIIKH